MSMFFAFFLESFPKLDNFGKHVHPLPSGQLASKIVRTHQIKNDIWTRACTLCVCYKYVLYLCVYCVVVSQFWTWTCTVQLSWVLLCVCCAAEDLGVLQCTPQSLTGSRRSTQISPVYFQCETLQMLQLEVKKCCLDRKGEYFSSFVYDF